MTALPPPALTDELRDLSRRFTDRAETVATASEADEWITRAGQLRLAAALVSGTAPDPAYIRIGEAFLDAGEKLLATDLDRIGGARCGR